ncbi:MAG TPA: PDZ domain-containing protein [Fimbriimonas sp.]|nr:PDZ domain-containing protein [Fimbriimonas sp.]
MCSSAVSLAFLLGAASVAQAQTSSYFFAAQARQAPTYADPGYRQVLPSMVTLMDQEGFVTGPAALIDSSGLYLASRNSIKSREMEGRFFNGQSGHLRVVAEDSCTQLDLLRSDYVPQGAKPVTLPSSEDAPGTPLIIVMSDGSIRARLGSTEKYGVIKPSNRALPLSEIRLESATVPIGGALIFTRKGAFVGMLNAALMRREQDIAFANTIKMGGALGVGPAGSGGFGGGAGGGASSRDMNPLPARGGLDRLLGPAQMTVAYTPGLDVMRKVFDGFTSTDHEVQYPTLGVFCRDGAGGALVQTVQSDSPAEKVGIRKSDLIIGIGNYRVENAITFGKAMFRQKVGDRITVRIDREGRLMQREVVVGKSLD